MAGALWKQIILQSGGKCLSFTLSIKYINVNVHVLCIGHFALPGFTYQFIIVKKSEKFQAP